MTADPALFFIRGSYGFLGLDCNFAERLHRLCTMKKTYLFLLVFSLFLSLPVLAVTQTCTAVVAGSTGVGASAMAAGTSAASKATAVRAGPNLSNISYAVSSVIDGATLGILINGGGLVNFASSASYSCVADPCQSPYIPVKDQATGVFQGCTLPGVPGTPSTSCASKAGKGQGQYSAPYVASEGISSPKYTNLCDGGCSVTVDYDIAAGGTRFGNGTATGGSCSPNPNSDGSDPLVPTTTSTTSAPIAGAPAPTPCKSTEYSGTVNGTQVCVPAQGTGVTVKDSSAAAKPSTPAASAPDIPGYPAGTKATETTTTCSGSTCTTSTSYSNSSGGSMGTNTTTVAKGAYCASTPTSPACGGATGSGTGTGDGSSGSWSGTCGAAPTCDGDAVMCAVAAATFATKCKFEEMTKPDDTASAAATAALNGSDGKNTDAMKADASANKVQISNFDVGGKGWGRSCPPDPTINIGFGKISTWTLPLSRICSPLQILANAAVGITLLASLVWTIGGRKT